MSAEPKEEPVSDRSYRGLVDSLAAGGLQAHSFLAAVESRVAASLPPVTAANSGGNVVHLAPRLSNARNSARP